MVSPTLFVKLRKQLKEDTFDVFSRTLNAFSEDLRPTSRGKDTPIGKLIIDATVADQYINYPTDLSLVNEARMKTEVIIDLLWKLVNDPLPVKRRSCRMVAHNQYLTNRKRKNLPGQLVQSPAVPAELRGVQLGVL